ncbi:MAG: hypothetical protein R2849_10660 [Thermomicrobiales bacterium]
MIASDLRNLVEVLLAAGHVGGWGVQFAGTAQALADSLGGSVGWRSIAGDVDVMTRVDTLQQQAQYESAWAEGCALKPEDALRRARALGDAGRRPTHPLRLLRPAWSRSHRGNFRLPTYLLMSTADRQIADALFIAPSTVPRMSTISSRKLELKSRMQVAG